MRNFIIQRKIHKKKDDCFIKLGSMGERKKIKFHDFEKLLNF